MTHKPQQENSDVDVAVVGAGLVGMLLALVLSRAGMRTMLLDKVAPESMLSAGFDGRTTALALGSQRLFHHLGLWEALAPHAGPIHDIRISDQDSALHLHYDHRDVGEEPMGYIVENRRIRETLWQACSHSARLSVATPKLVTKVEQFNSHALIHLQNDAIISAKLVCACDGKHSAMRDYFDIETTEWAYPQTAIVCTVRHKKDHQNIAHERFLSAGPFAILPMPGNRSSIVWTEGRELAGTLMELDDAAFLEELALRFGNFLGALELEGPRFAYPLSLLHARQYHQGRGVLVGDAAHAIHPIAGQGVNLGFRDVGVLEELLSHQFHLGLDLAEPSLLARYERWRHFDTMSMIAATDLLNRLFSNDITPLRIARRLGLAAVERIPPIKTFFMRHAMGLVGDLPRLMRADGKEVV